MQIILWLNGVKILMSPSGLSTSSSQRMFYIYWEKSKCFLNGGSAKLASWHGTQKLMAISVVEVPTKLISNFHGDPIGKAHTQLHWSTLTLDQSIYVKIALPEIHLQIQRFSCPRIWPFCSACHIDRQIALLLASSLLVCTGSSLFSTGLMQLVNRLELKRWKVI